MADVATPPLAALIGFHACDRCGPSIRSTEMWRREDGNLIISFCQSHATRYQVRMWEQHFRLYMKAPVS